jgi:hypothetical protein
MFESHFCAALADRVQIHTARYMSDEEVGRIWIVLDKKQIFSAADNASPNRPFWYSKDGCVYWNEYNSRYSCESRLEDYLNYSIEEALASTDELIRAFAMFDKRVGKRRLHSFIEEMKNAPMLVQHFYAIRCQAAGIETFVQ